MATRDIYILPNDFGGFALNRLNANTSSARIKGSASNPPPATANQRRQRDKTTPVRHHHAELIHIAERQLNPTQPGQDAAKRNGGIPVKRDIHSSRADHVRLFSARTQPQPEAGLIQQEKAGNNHDKKKYMQRGQGEEQIAQKWNPAHAMPGRDRRHLWRIAPC